MSERAGRHTVKYEADGVQVGAISRQSRRDLRVISARSRRNLGQVVEAAASAGSESLTLQPGELVYEQGDLAGAFYVIESGEVRSDRDLIAI